MDEFYAECDDHLLAARRSLLKLEEADTPDPQELEDVFRRLHSLKGILGMAGLQSAERVAHRAEDYLRGATRAEGRISNEGLDILTQVIGILEQLAVAHREGQPSPEIGPILERLDGLIVQDSGGTAEGRPSRPVAQSGASGRVIWLCRFVPSAELDGRGVNLNTVRPRLQALGRILRSTPKVQSEGAIEFEFLVEGPPNADQIADWAEDGITLTRHEGGSAEDRPQPKAQESHESDRLAQRAAAFVAPSHVVRVDLSRLDDLMRIMGEMVLHRARLDELLGRISPVIPITEERALQEVNVAFTRELRHLREALMRVRLVPISEIFDRMPFVVRDLAHQSGKKVRLVIKGQNTEIDKYLVERLKDPLLHMVRNAISHGIEPASVRAGAGKAEEGVISLSASTAGETVVIEVADDGKGVDTAEVTRRARGVGLAPGEEAGTPAVLDIICTPGFSTRDEADLAAGRGMGMAAVRKTINELGGELEMTTRAGQGTTFVLRLPLTLAIADALVIASGGQRFAMPQSAVQEITTARASSVQRLEENELLSYRNGVLPLIRLSTLFGLPEEERAEFPVLVVGTGRRAVGIVADRVLGQREIVVRAMSDPLLKVPAISGATELGDGRAVLILDSVALLQAASRRKGKGGRESDEIGGASL
jgi:two-component system chemotaxis sensor kinase CheA